MKVSKLKTGFLALGIVAGGLGFDAALPSAANAGGDKCIDYAVHYAGATSDVGTFCGGNTVTRSDVATLHALELHISCSDDLSQPTKSDLDGNVVIDWTIVKGDKTCGSSTAGILDPKAVEKAAEKAAKEAEKAAKKAAKAAEKSAKSVKAKSVKSVKEKSAKAKSVKSAKSSKADTGKSKCITFDIRYTDGTRDAGDFCGGNNITKADDPNLNANSIHISCSDDLYNPSKSDLAGKTVASYQIIKSGKVCGDPTLPDERQVTVTFTCSTATVVSNTPIENSTALFDDGTKQYVWGAGRTTYTVESTNGRRIVALWVDGTPYWSDADDSGPGGDNYGGPCSPPDGGGDLGD